MIQPPACYTRQAAVFYFERKREEMLAAYTLTAIFSKVQERATTDGGTLAGIRTRAAK